MYLHELHEPIESGSKVWAKMCQYKDKSQKKNPLTREINEIVTRIDEWRKPSEEVARLHNRAEGTANVTQFCLGSIQVKTRHTQRHPHTHRHTEDTWGIVQRAAPSIEVVTVTVTVSVNLEDHLSPCGTIWSLSFDHDWLKTFALRQIGVCMPQASIVKPRAAPTGCKEFLLT